MRLVLVAVGIAACAHAPGLKSPACTEPLAIGGDAVADTPQPLAGTVASVAIEGAPELAPLLRGVVETHTGQDVSAAPLREDLRRLWAFGVLGDARVDAHEVDGGLAIVFDVTPQPRVARVFGAEALELRRLRWFAGTPYEPVRVLRVAREIETAYVRDGYMDASVVVKRHGFDLCVRAYRGPVVKIRNVVFAGAKQVAPATLLGTLHGKGVNRPGGTYDPQALEDDSLWLLNEYYERGLIQARVGTATIERFGNSIDVTVPVTEGEVFRIGEMSGLVVPTTIHRGDVFVRSKLATAMQVLGDKLDANVVPVTQLDEPHRTIAIQLQPMWRMPWSALRYFSH